MSKITVAIIDDHQVVIDGLMSMLDDNPEVAIVFATTSPQELLDFVKADPVDVVMLDVHMPGIDGIDLCGLILKAQKNTRILVFSSFDDTHYVRQTLRKGALGYVLKNAGKAVLLDAILSVYNEKEYIDETIRKQLVHESITGQKKSMYEIPLTKREREILKLVAEEYNNKEIAEKLFLSLRTVETHRANLSKKLDAKNTVSLVKEAMKRGYID